MQIQEIHTHMSVNFGRRRAEVRHFSIENKRKFGELSLSIVPGLGVKAQNSEDSIIIPFVNILFIKTEEEKSELPEMSTGEREALGLDSEDEPDDELELDD